MKENKRKATKPTLPPGEKKVPVTFRVHPSVKELYQEKADLLFGGNVTKYITYTLEDKKNNEITLPTSHEKVDRSLFYSLIRELNKTGNNLNQLARKANMGHFINSPLEKTLQDLIKQKEELFALLVEKLEDKIPNT